MERKLIFMNPSLDNSTINTMNYTPKNNTINITNEMIYKDYTIGLTKRIQGKFNNAKENNDKKGKNTNIINCKKTKINKYNYNNGNNIMLKNYAKSLRYAYNTHIHAINTQFNNYNRDSFTKKNNTYRFVDNNKLNNSLNTVKNNNLNYDSRNKKVQRDKNCKNLKIKTLNNNYRINNDAKMYINEFTGYEIIQKIIKIQTYYRAYFTRRKLYNTFLLYSKISNLFGIIVNGINFYKKLFMENIKQKEKIIKNINKAKIELNKNNSVINSKSNTKIISNLKKRNEEFHICNINKITFKEEPPNNNNNHFSYDKANISNYYVCNVNNININTIENKNNIHNIPYNNKDEKSLFEDKKIYEEKIKKLIDENKIIKEKNIEYQKNEDIYNNIKLENAKLNIINNEINKAKAQLLYDLKNTKKEYEKLLNERKNLSQNNIIIKPIEINIINEKGINNNNNFAKRNNKNINNENEIKENMEDNSSNTLNKNCNIIDVKMNDKKEREKYLKNLFKIKVFEMRDYVHKCFTKFYYNGIFLQMTGKLSHLEQKSENNKEISEVNMENENKCINNIKSIKGESSILDIKKQQAQKEKDKQEQENNDLKARLKKSRGLRKLMAKKANERMEILRVNFYRFYRAGIIHKFRSMKKRKTCEVRGSINLSNINKEINSGEENSLEKKSRLKSAKNLISKEIKEKEELKKKIVSSLEKIIFKIDRKNMIIMKTIFQKFYLKAKLESVTNIIDNDKVKKKKKKKMKKKNKSVSKEIIVKEENQNNDNDNDEIKEIKEIKKDINDNN